MNNKKQSSIDWLIEKIQKQREDGNTDLRTTLFFCQQAKAMHKYEILETFEKAYLCGYRDNGDGGIDYYNEKFGGQENG